MQTAEDNCAITVCSAPSAERRRPRRRGRRPEVGDATSDRVGGFELRIVCGADSPESRRRWEQRSEALAAWLLARWREQHGQEARN